MEAEWHNVLCISPVYRSHVSGIKQHQVALLLGPIKADGHQDTIILCNCIRVGNKTSFTIVVVFLKGKVSKKKSRFPVEM